jgi:glycosyltransferase involved in cell wall biosynthesis
MRVCAVSFKECWQGPDQRWLSDGGFPMQMTAIGSLFDEMDLVIVKVAPRAGGSPLPAFARVHTVPRPLGSDAVRKLFLLPTAPLYLAMLARLVRDADVVHTPLPGDIPLLALLVGAAMRKRLLARYCGSWATTKRTTVMNRVTKQVMRVLSNDGNVMLATGEGFASPGGAVEWIYSTALTRAEIEGIQPQLNRGLAAVPHLVYLGRLSPEKGVANLIRALAALKAERFEPLPRLTIAGDGPDRAKLEALAAAGGCADIVDFRGQLARAELSRLLLSADLAVQPSLTEGFCKAWIDALAHGLPVLATRVGAAEHVMGQDGERGWLIAPGDAPALTAALRRTLNELIDWPALRQRCREFAEARTIEGWRDRIGEICCCRWTLALVDGRLHE